MTETKRINSAFEQQAHFDKVTAITHNKCEETKNNKEFLDLSVRKTK